MKAKDKARFLVKLARLFNQNEQWRFLGIMAMVFTTALFQTVGIAAILPFMKLVLDPASLRQHERLSWAYQALGFTDAGSFVVVLGLIIVGIIILGNLIAAFSSWLENRFIWRKSHALATLLLRKYLTKPYAYFLNRNTSHLGKNVLDEVQNLTKNVMVPLMEIFSELVLIFLIFLALLIISPLVAVSISIVFLILYTAIYKTGLRQKLKARGNQRLEENTGRFKSLAEALGGIKDIKILGRESYFLQRFSDYSARYSDLQSWHATTIRLPRYFIEIIVFGGLMMFILFVLSFQKNAAQIIPLVTFFAFAGYRLMPMVNRVFQAFTLLQFNQPVLDRIYFDLVDGDDAKTAALGKAAVAAPVAFKQAIRLQGLSFQYPGARDFVFQNISLTIEKNSSVAFVGPTGSGKTTLIDVMLGLLSPAAGTIFVDGIELTGANMRGWQKHFGYVPQHIYLTDATIRRNIAFGIPDEAVEQEKIEKATRIANLHDFIIRELPQGYDTVIGERGIRLSGGQRQRVGIARALYHDPDVLVFDEATSSLDGATEEAVLMAIENILRVKTLIVIAHRLTTVKKCDRIYLVDQGKILASGTYEELLSNNPQFRKMAGTS